MIFKLITCHSIKISGHLLSHGTQEPVDVEALQTQPVSPASLGPVGRALAQNQPMGRAMG